MYDIVIVGGGISGSVLGKFLDKKYKVLILEKRDFNDENNKKIKSCGGLLAHEAQAALSSLGYGMPKEVLVSPQVFYVKVYDLDNDLENFYYKDYINFDREKFDNWLLDKASKNVEVKRGVIYKSYQKVDTGYEINFFEKGVKKKVLTKKIIGADGAASQVRNQFYNGREFNRQYVTIQRVYKMDREFSYHGAIFDSTINPYYSWFIPKEGKFILGTALKKCKDVKKKFNQLEEKMKQKGFDLSNPICDEGTVVNKPHFGEFYPGDDDIILIGEAAGFISPSSHEGISFAIRSAHLLSKALNKNIDKPLSIYKKSLWKIRLSIFMKIFKAKIMYNRFFRKYIIKSNVFAGKQYFE